MHAIPVPAAKRGNDVDGYCSGTNATQVGPEALDGSIGKLYLTVSYD